MRGFEGAEPALASLRELCVLTRIRSGDEDTKSERGLSLMVGWEIKNCGTIAEAKFPLFARNSVFSRNNGNEISAMML